MKKLILSALLIGTLLSCSSSDDDSSNSNQNDCNCGQVIQCMNFYIPNAPFTVIKVKNNCTGEIKTVNLDGTQLLLNTQYCN